MSELAKMKCHFDDFLFIMDEQIESLENDASERGQFINASMESLDQLEELFIIMSSENDSEMLAGQIVYFARYLGEIVIREFGGKWDLPLADINNINYNAPVVVGHSPVAGLEFSPIGVVRSFSLRHKRGLFRSAILAQTNPNPIDLSDLAARE